MKTGPSLTNEVTPLFSAQPPMRRNQRAFSLVEVVTAIGIVAFAFVGILSLIPAGMSVFRDGMDVSLSAQIAQRITSETSQSDFDALVPQDGNVVAGVSTGGASGQFYALPLRYFDDQGTELGLGDGTATTPTLTEDEKNRVIYVVRVRGSLPGVADPDRQDSGYFTSLPASTSGEYPNSSRFNPRFVTFLTIQVVKNPARLALDSFIDGSSFLIDATAAKAKSLPVKTFTTIVARNGYLSAN